MLYCPCGRGEGMYFVDMMLSVAGCLRCNIAPVWERWGMYFVAMMLSVAGICTQ